MTAYLYSAPAGDEGMLTDVVNSDVETVAADPAKPFPFYGTFGKLDASNGLFRPVQAGDTGGIYGWLVKRFPTPAGYVDATGAIIGGNGGNFVAAMRRGRGIIKLRGAGTPAINGQVYIRVATPTTGNPLGSLESAADSGNCIAVPGAYFMTVGAPGSLLKISYGIQAS